MVEPMEIEYDLTEFDMNEALKPRLTEKPMKKHVEKWTNNAKQAGNAATGLQRRW